MYHFTLVDYLKIISLISMEEPNDTPIPSTDMVEGINVIYVYLYRAVMSYSGLLVITFGTIRMIHKSQLRLQ